MNLALLLQMAADGMGTRLALTSKEGSFSYRALNSRVQGAASAIADDPGERVVYLGRNSPVVPIALFASGLAGKPFVPLNYRLPNDRLRALVSRSAPALVIADEDMAARVMDIPDARVVTAGTFLEIANVPGQTTFSGTENSIAVLLFTSGTTGEPKAAVLRHQHLAAYVIQSIGFMAADEDEAALVSVPPYHIAGISAILTGIYSGRRIVQMPVFTPADWIVLARRETVTHAMVVPTMLGRILEEMDRRQATLPALRHLSYGGGHMPRPVIERAMRRLPNVDFVNAYGLTETSSTISILSPEDHRRAFRASTEKERNRLGSVGKPLPGLEVEIRTVDGDRLPPDALGEIWVRGEQVSGEYLGNRTIRDDGWLPTNDCGRLDDEGYLYLEGRLDDIIVRGGENISPGEIEDVLRSHEGVRDVAVVGVPDEEWGERIAAVVVARRPVSAAELQDWVKARLRSTKTPQEVHFRDELPFNEMGKLLRRGLRAELMQASPNAQPKSRTTAASGA